MSETYDATPVLKWSRLDPEQWIGLSGSRFTRTGTAITLAVAVVLTGVFYWVLSLFPGSRLVQMFTERGMTQYVCVLFAAWGLAILLFKANKVSIQRRALQLRLVPNSHDFVLSTGTASQVLEKLHDASDQPDRFILFNRIEIALSNLRNMGRVSDLSEVLRAQAENDEAMSESTFSLLKGLVWAIPVLGFIGTVQGLSLAVGTFGGVLAGSSDLSEVRPALQGVTAGLATAFETTLVALIAALSLHLLMTFVKRAEEQLLDECTEYCQKQLLARVRLTPFESE